MKVTAYFHVWGDFEKREISLASPKLLNMIYATKFPGAFQAVPPVW